MTSGSAATRPYSTRPSDSMGAYKPERPAGYPSAIHRRDSKELKNNARWFRHIEERHLIASQLSPTFTDATGTITKPPTWQIATRDPAATLAELCYAGEVLLGQDTPIGASSYTIGIPATLPTGGYARLNGGVTARTS